MNDCYPQIASTPHRCKIYPQSSRITDMNVNNLKGWNFNLFPATNAVVTISVLQPGNVVLFYHKQISMNYFISSIGGVIWNICSERNKRINDFYASVWYLKNITKSLAGPRKFFGKQKKVCNAGSSFYLMMLIFLLCADARFYQLISKCMGNV